MDASSPSFSYTNISSELLALQKQLIGADETQRQLRIAAFKANLKQGIRKGHQFQETRTRCCKATKEELVQGLNKRFEESHNQNLQRIDQIKEIKPQPKPQSPDAMNRKLAMNQMLKQEINEQLKQKQEKEAKYQAYMQQKRLEQKTKDQKVRDCKVVEQKQLMNQSQFCQYQQEQLRLLQLRQSKTLADLRQSQTMFNKSMTNVSPKHSPAILNLSANFSK